MNCPHCGGNTPVAQARCSGCGKPVSARPAVATGLLTPMPPLSTSASDDVTGYVDIGRTSASPPRQPAPPDPDVTGFRAPSDPDVTGFSRPRTADVDDATYSGEGPAPNDSVAGGPLTIGQRFGPRYRIVRLLGIGGMGAVYQAWDSELDVVVALKVIRPEATRDPAEAHAIERRFKQELLLARQVTHKNVVRIHDLGEIDDIKYITMSYIEGEDLATILKTAVKLAVPAALKIMRQLASGLVAAHDAGVVHRDLKPANIMVEGERVVIMDFGIARSAGGAQPTAPAGQTPTGGFRHLKGGQQTSVGTIVGTIAYMAPEQARGQAVDQRADIYSFGLIAADMLVGPRMRGSNESAIEELQRRIKERPPALRTLDPLIPEAVERIVSRCVEPDPGARFQTTAELVAALDRLDQKGMPIPLVRRLTPRLVATTALLVTVLLAGTYLGTRRALEPVTEPEPVAVVIADFENNTSDTAFTRTLEPMIRRGLEGAGFISAYDRTRVTGALGVRPPEKLDEAAAREIAVKQGLGVVLAGSITSQGDGYALLMKAVHTVTGNVITTAEDHAANREDVLPAATRLVAAVRTALGDATPESEQMFAMTSLSVTSLEVVQHYAAGMAASSNNKFEEARQAFAKAVELDPKFGLGYSSLAAASRNLGRVQDAEKYIKQALQYLDGMTERERYSTRGFFYRMTADYQQCVKEYGELIARFSADIVGRNQRALCMTKLRDMRGAVEEMRHVVALLPNRAVFRDNLALYSNYAGDFDTAESEARTVGASDAFALLALAFAQVGRGQIAPATETYQTLQKINATGASLAASGLADLAMVQGHYAEAVRILNAGVATDLAAKNTDRAATKLAAISQVELLRGRTRAAMDAADKALTHSQAVKIRFMAARTFVGAGDLDRAQPLIGGLASELQAEPQAYAKIVEGEIALHEGKARDAIKLLTDANSLLDTWIGHFVLGRAYLEAGAFIQADSEFDRCIKRRGEALSLFVDEDPTSGYFPPVYYYQGRVREGLKNAGFADSYKAYLTFRGQSKEDPLLIDVRRRAGN